MPTGPTRDELKGTGSAAIVALLLFAGLTALVWSDPERPAYLVEADEWWRRALSDPPPWTGRTARALFTVGGGAYMVPLRLVVTAWLLIRRRYTDVVAWLLAWIVADAVTTWLKIGVDRLRPDGSDTSSFPSGHAKTAAQVAVGMALLASGRWRAWAASAAIAWISAMALSRMVLDHHWFTDVLAGSLVGAGCALGAFAFVRGVAGRRRVDRDSHRGPPGG